MTIYITFLVIVFETSGILMNINTDLTLPYFASTYPSLSLQTSLVYSIFLSISHRLVWKQRNVFPIWKSSITIRFMYLPVKSIDVGLKASFVESILCKSGTNSGGIEEKASLDK